MSSENIRPSTTWRRRKQYLGFKGDQDSAGHVSFPPGPNQPRFDPATGQRITDTTRVGLAVKLESDAQV